MNDRAWDRTTVRIAGCDLGKSTAAFSVGDLYPDGTLEVAATRVVTHDGRPFDVFLFFVVV